MATWGRTSKKSAKSSKSTASSRPRSSTSNGRPAKGAGSRGTPTKASAGASKRGTAVDDDRTEEMPASRRRQAGDEARSVVDGREDEFIGIGLIAAGVLLALAWDPLESTCRHASLSIL